MAGHDLVDRLQGFLSDDPDNWSLRADTFDAALAAGERETARAQVEYVLRARPDDASWRHREAVLLLAGRQYAEAQAAFEALIAQGHGHPIIHYNRAFALFAQGRVEAARDAVAPLLKSLDEAAAIAWVLWLRCQHRLGQLKEALDAFVAETLRAQPTPDASGVASLIAIDGGSLEDARTWSERALQGRADQLEALSAKGTLALVAQDGPGASEWFGRALAVNGRDGRSWSGLAFAKMLQQRFPEALDAFEKAVATMPDHVGTWLGFGWCQILLKQPEAARASFEAALRVDENVAESHGALAVALVRLGRIQEAQERIDVALRLDPKGLSARYAQAVLSGETEDPAAFLRLSRRVLSRRPLPVGGKPGETMADIVFGPSKE